ncbi:hypothetical protein GGR58DRAFT_496931 [Xylaria digitata]|nr:hypothetical protein GGR58DRAFT_496931 [Xylaria digitata]
MASTPSTNSDATFILKSSIIKKAPQDTLRDVSNALSAKLRAAQTMQELHPEDTIDTRGIDPVQHVTLLASTPAPTNNINGDEGGKDGPTPTNSLPVDRFVLRLPCEDALVPNQVTNEVTFKRSVQKEAFARKLATITVDLAEVQFGVIGGLDAATFSSAPTVDGPKLFKGRHKFHRNECYTIGPYHSTKEYILACYDREIYYYSNVSADIDTSFFEETSVQAFIDQLQAKRQALAAETIDDEPFVLVHGDFHGRNILERDGRIVPVLDWEFAGSYLLSEILSGGDVDVVGPDSEELDEENTVWGRKVRGYIIQEVESRAWDRDKIDMLLENGNRELGEARTEMLP